MPQKFNCIVILTSAPSSVEELRRALEKSGYHILVAKSFSEATRQPADDVFPLCLLDRVHFPLNRLRHRPPTFAKSLLVSFWPAEYGCTEEQFLREMEAGIDDVFAGETYRQMVAKIRTLFRRYEAEANASHILKVGELQMDVDKYEVSVDGQPVSLTPKEFAILKCFLQAPGQAISRQVVLSRVWGEEYALDQHALDVHVHALRQKIEKNPERPSLIVTVRGVGYKLKND